VTVLAASSSFDLALIALAPLVIAIAVVALTLLGHGADGEEGLRPLPVPVHERRPRHRSR
jgi:hypothetical protein